MDKIIPAVIIALIVGGVIGYFLHSGISSTPKSESQQKTMSDKQSSQPSAESGSKEWKIQNAKSAGPEAISKEATVFDWPEKEGALMATLQTGTNDWTCLPDYPVSPGNDPICVDKQSLLWFQAYMTKKEPQLSQLGLSYMLQGASDASNTDPFAQKPAPGEDWVSAPPHLMVFPTGKLDQSVFGTDDKSGKPWIMWAGTPYEHLMIPVK